MGEKSIRDKIVNAVADTLGKNPKEVTEATKLTFPGGGKFRCGRILAAVEDVEIQFTGKQESQMPDKDVAKMKTIGDIIRFAEQHWAQKPTTP